MDNEENSQKYRRLALALVLTVTLFAGLHPKGFNFQNSVSQSEGGAALKFSKYSVAFTDSILDGDTIRRLNEEGFELALSLGPEAEDQDGFTFIALIHSGDDAKQFLVGRWADHVIVMNGDDYKYRFKQSRVSAKLTDSQRTNGVNLVVRSGPDGSMIELDGVVGVQGKDVRLQIPHGPDDARIVLGNSVYGIHSWEGSMLEFVLSAQGQKFDPVIGFTMLFNLGDTIPGHGSVDGDLHLPMRTVVVERRFLAWPFGHQFEINSSFISDVLINLFGFIPLGFVAAMTVAGTRWRQRLSVALVVAIIVSCLIEYLQTWMPSRSSNAVDFVLNALGGLSGGVLHVVLACVLLGNERADQPEGQSAVE